MGINSKIAVLCNYKLLPERVGGMDYFFWMFDQKCKENGIEVDWFFPNKSTHQGYKSLHIITQEGESLEPLFLDYCIQNNPDYKWVITHFIELCIPYYKAIKRVCDAKIIAVDHNPRPLNGYSFKKKIEKKVKGLLYSRYIDLFVGVSDYCKNQIIKEYGTIDKEKVIVIFNGLEIERFKKKTNFNSNTKFIIASHLRQQKGIQDVIEAVNMLQNEQVADFKIDLYGEGDFEKQLKAMVKNYALDGIFNFQGSVTNLNELYCEYDFLIHPSHGETFCYTVIESLLCNLPVITTKKQGNVLNFVKENRNGFLFNVSDTYRLKEIIKGIVKQELKIENGLEKEPFVTELSLQEMVSNYFKLLA